MKVIRAQKAGFCFGVALALRKLDMLVRQDHGLRVATFGEIIHNPAVLRSYAEQGVVCLEDPGKASRDMAVLIRAHGIPRSVEGSLKKRVGLLQDATCPKVKKAQMAIAEATAGGARLFLYGETEHPEVQGLISYACGEKRIFSSFQELKGLESEWGRGTIVLAAQTTQDRAQFEEMKSFLAGKMKDRLIVLDTICDATRQRQEEISMLARMSDAVVVAGGRSSGNTRRLAELARMLDVPTMLVESEEELDPQFFSGKAVVALTAGASTPREIIDAVEKRLLCM
ncbi:MAG: 4-hydroxy-3-methylbut-2-enyl diphosphate reductase [Desulfovibrio sp.]|jgi:4-hydroxy-3-methylbut-2-enyl diphosphate reductase